MSMTPRQIAATVLATLLVASAVGGVAALAAAPVAADQHTVDTATDYTDEANFTVNFPFTTDHYPGSQNAQNGSIQYWAVGEQAMRDIGAEEGAFISHVVISSDWIDYSACSTDNTAAFGIDRGNDNPGTQIDEDLVSRMKDPDFREDGLTITFYGWDDFGGDPPYAAAEDAIVAEQGARSSAGSCLTVTDEPGWYQVQGFVNGTEADNGPNDPPSDGATHAGILAYSNYQYVCECDSEAEAREQLGPPPGDDPEPTPTATDDGSGNDTPEPTPTATDDGSGNDTPEPTSAGTDGGTDARTATPTDTDGGSDGPTTADGNGDGDGDGGDGNATPTPGEGPGFGTLAALVALLATALLANRRG